MAWRCSHPLLTSKVFDVSYRADVQESAYHSFRPIGITDSCCQEDDRNGHEGGVFSDGVYEPESVEDWAT